MRKLLKQFGSKAFIITSLLLFSWSTSAQEMDPEISIATTLSDSNLEWGPCPEFMPEGCSIAILHGDPSKENADLFFRVPANSEIPNHWHTSAERMILISGEMEVTYEGEKPINLKKGAYAYGPAKKPHTARCGDEGPCVLFIAFEEPVDVIAVEE